MSAEAWQLAQQNELEIWERSVRSPSAVFSELQETAELVEFGASSGLIQSHVTSVIELGIGPMGIGWGSFGSADHVVGVDPLPRLEIRTEIRSLDRFARELQERVTYLQADASEPLPFDDGRFDLVVCDNVIDHTLEPFAILATAVRLAKPGGVFLFGVNVFSAIGILKWRCLTRRLHSNDANVLCHPHSFREREISELLERARWHPMIVKGASRMHRVLGRAYRLRAVAVRE